MQYIWTHHEEYQAKFTGWKRKLFDRIVPKLRNRDQHFTSFTTVRSNSVYTQQCAREIYGIDSEVSYPKVSDAYRLAGISSHPKPYFVCVGRVVNFVRECGLIIELFNRLQLPLLMIGSGPDEEVLKAKA